MSVGVNPERIQFQTAWLHFTLLDYLFTFKAEDYSYSLFSLPLLKAELNAKLHCIQIFMSNLIKIKVKCAIGKAILHKRIHVLVLICMICCLFSNCSKSSTTRLRSLYITFYLCCECSTFLCACTPHNAMRRSIEICLL